MSERGVRYDQVGVRSNAEVGLDALLRSINQTHAFRDGRPTGRSLLDVGYFANVIDIAPGLGLAMATDGVGTKVLIAELLERYDTVGIDCVAMNVNDLICVGAEPVSLVDYIAVEDARPEMLEALGKGFLEGARQAGVNIVGGEISQMGEVIKGIRPGSGIDLVATCVGVVATDRINVGQDVAPGDRVLSLPSSGIHSNGLTLARRVLLERHDVRDHVAALGRSVGEELLEPTRIYVKPIRALLDAGLPIRAMVNITGGGLFNLCRVKPAVGFRLPDLPEPPPVFRLIQDLGGIDNGEMYKVFNMGIGFCLIVPPDDAVVADVRACLAEHDLEPAVIGEVTDDPERKVELPGLKLVGKDEVFTAA